MQKNMCQTMEIGFIEKTNICLIFYQSKCQKISFMFFSFGKYS